MPDPVLPEGPVEERDGPLRPIAGVATDVAGFVGVTETGPTAPTLVTSWAGFQQTFGGVIDQPPFVTPFWRLPYAVRGFFENGGRQAWIARVLDALAPASPGDLAGVIGEATGAAAATGIEGLMAQAEITLMAVPDDVVEPAFAAALLDRCERSRDRLAIVTVASGATAPQAVSLLRDSSYGALYYPHLHVPAPHLPRGYVVASPSGHVAGTLARLDVGSGQHTDGGELAAVGLIDDRHPSGVGALDRHVTARDVEQLAPRGVNALRDFRRSGRGIRVWGARTMSSDPAWKYVHLRRLFLFLEHSIEGSTQWVVFEPNAEPTWAVLRAAVTDFLHGRWRAGAFAGATPREAFFVRCDRSTMTQEDIDTGRLVCEVGVAPLRPAEFVIFRIGHWTHEHP